MKTLVQFGAPANILVDGKPHLGTDRLVPLLRNFRQHLKGLGVCDITCGLITQLSIILSLTRPGIFQWHYFCKQVDIKFSTRLNDLIVENRQVVGVQVSDASHSPDFDNQELLCDGVVLAVGHSARDVYQMLLQHDVELVPKDFAVSLLYYF